MFKRVFSAGISGVEAYIVGVEVDMSDGLPCFDMVGTLTQEVREARERVKTALKNLGFSLPAKRITVNLSPANVRKEGCGFDLPIAVAVLAAMGIVRDELLDHTVFVGELSLDGSIRPVRGVLSLSDQARKEGFKRLVSARENREEAAVISEIQALGAEDLLQVIRWLNYPEEIDRYSREMEQDSNAFGRADEEKCEEIIVDVDAGTMAEINNSEDRMGGQQTKKELAKRKTGQVPQQEAKQDTKHKTKQETQQETISAAEPGKRHRGGSVINIDRPEPDFCEVSGQAVVRRAAEVAAAGMHNLLLIGPPGSGKTMIASRIPTILPGLTREEQIEITKLHSICGQLPPGEALMTRRPFRAPHHTVPPTALIGGGRIPKPGEISLAHGGVLFLDELPEFNRYTLEALRQPLEEGKITVSRLQASWEFPADMMLVAAMNPCPCGYYPDRNTCNCGDREIHRYLSHISRPILDRLDICVEAPRVSYEELSGVGNRQEVGNLQEVNNLQKVIAGKHDEAEQVGRATGEKSDIEEKRTAGMKSDIGEKSRGQMGMEKSRAGQTGKNESSADIRRRVEAARALQRERFAGTNIRFNSKIPASEIGKYCRLGEKEERMMRQIFDRMHLSARGYHRILRVARTIADLAGEEEIGLSHLGEAVCYRGVEEKFWGNER